jgi:hypothetical protein
MPPNKRTKYCQHLAYLCEYATCGQKHIMEVVAQMMHETGALPDDLKLYGEEMTKISMEALISNYIESFQLMSELGLQEIARAEIPPPPRTEPDQTEKE